MEKMNLKSVKMQRVVFPDVDLQEWFTPLLRFEKNKVFKMDLYITSNNEMKIKECYDELMSFVGKDTKELRSAYKSLVDKYDDKKWCVRGIIN